MPSASSILWDCSVILKRSGCLALATYFGANLTVYLHLLLPFFSSSHLVLLYRSRRILSSVYFYILLGNPIYFSMFPKAVAYADVHRPSFLPCSKALS